MPQIMFVEANGQSTTVDVPVGWSLMQGATTRGVEGILGECGGSCSCATCHCYVDDLLAKVLPPPLQDEIDMLENVASERRSNSRLACQIRASVDHEGCVVTLPERQE